MKIVEHYWRAADGEQRIDISNEGRYHIVYVQKRTMSVVTLGSEGDNGPEERKALTFAQEYLNCISSEEKSTPEISESITETKIAESTNGNTEPIINSDPSGQQNIEKGPI